MADITPIASLTGELAMPEKVWMQGPPGPQGPKGDTGETGPAGAGVPDGGTVGQLLGKTESGTAWIDPPQSGGGGSVPKPLTYDYMPEGYPKKTMETVTVMVEQKLEFAPVGSAGVYRASLTEALVLVGGQTYTVNWDGTEYECVCVDDGKYTMLGNISISGQGADTGEPFLCLGKDFGTFDTSATHTISVKRIEETVTPIAEEFLPNIVEIDSIIIKSSTTDSAKKFKITVDDSGTLTTTEVT